MTSYRVSLIPLIATCVLAISGTAGGQSPSQGRDPMAGCLVEVSKLIRMENRTDNSAPFSASAEMAGRHDETIPGPVDGSLLSSTLDSSVELRMLPNERIPPFLWEAQNEDAMSALFFKANRPNPQRASLKANSGIQWKETLLQSLSFTTIMNMFRFATEPSTRKDLKGPFWKDYFNSIKNLRGWKDGDEFIVNYVGHPMEGAISGSILIQNDQASAQLQFGRSKQYWKSRLKALGWAAALSTQFELGPFGEATIGNVGLKPSEKSKHPSAYVDLVVTPLAGTGWLIGEDMLDRFIVRRIEGRTTNRLIRSLLRSWLNPSRAFANMLRGQWWWHRDDRPLKEGGRGPSK